MRGETGVLSRRELLRPRQERFHPEVQHLRGKVGSNRLLLRAHLHGHQELRDLAAFPKNQPRGLLVM